MELLDPNTSSEKPITKKEACEILNISYNTQRLTKIIEEFHAKKEYREKRKAQNRGKPASDYEIKTVAENYLEGSSVSEIAQLLFRSSSFVKNIINRVGIPAKKLSDEEPNFLPEECVSEEFSSGDIVWSTFYNGAARVLKEETSMDYENKYGSKCYQIYVMTPEVHNPDSFFGDVKGGFYAYQCAHELGNLEHLNKYGLNVARLAGL